MRPDRVIQLFPTTMSILLSMLELRQRVCHRTIGGARALEEEGFGSIKTDQALIGIASKRMEIGLVGLTTTEETPNLK